MVRKRVAQIAKHIPQDGSSDTGLAHRYSPLLVHRVAKYVPLVVNDFSALAVGVIPVVNGGCPSVDSP